VRIVMMPIRKKPSTTAILLTGMFFCSLPIALLFAVNLLGFDVEYTPRSWCVYYTGKGSVLDCPYHGEHNSFDLFQGPFGARCRCNKCGSIFADPMYGLKDAPPT